MPRRDRRRRAASAAWLLSLVAGLPAPAGAQIPVELELVLLSDASSSILGGEFDLQIGGYARAFRDPRVIAAIRGLGGNGIAVAFVQWSAAFQQIEAVPWQHLRTEADARAFADAIETQARRFASFGTATGSAMMHAEEMLRTNAYEGRRRVIDITSDEHSNQGTHPRTARRHILARGITVNGLAILDDAFDLEAYFRNNVVGGPDAFILAVETYDDFAAAILRKLVREISGTPVAGLSRPD